MKGGGKKSASKVPLLFISYAHVDNAYRERVRIHLTPLVRGNVLCVFDDSQLERDEGWRVQLKKQLNQAHLVLMLVSPDFLHSEYCFEEEWPIARKRWKAKEPVKLAVQFIEVLSNDAQQLQPSFLGSSHANPNAAILFIRL